MDRWNAKGQTNGYIHIDGEMDGWNIDGGREDWMDGSLYEWMNGYGGIDGCAITLNLKYNDVYVCFELCNTLVLLCSFGSYLRLYK